MSEGNDQDAGKGRLSLRPAGRMELGRTVDAGSVRQSFSHGRSKVVQVEVAIINTIWKVGAERGCGRLRWLVGW